MLVGDSEYIVIAQDKVGCLTADGNVDDFDLHRAPKHIIKINWPHVQGRKQGVDDEDVRTFLSSYQHPVTRAAEV